MNTSAQIEKGISAIDLGNCINVIKENYNMTQNESFYVLNIESKRNNTENSEESKSKSYNLGKGTQIEIFDKSGNKLDLSICKQNIKIMKYIDNAEELDMESAEDFYKQGIDVFNAKDDFFNNICHDFSNIDGKDIIINDRRNDIYQNATFCQNGCSYSGIDYKLMVANCICNSSSLQSNPENNDTNKENKNNVKEIVNFKTLTKSIIESLFDFNLEVIKCYNLVFNMKIFYNNIGFYCMAILIFLQIIFLFVFLIKRLKPLKLFMLIFSSYNPKAKNFFPPPKNKKKMKRKKNNFVDDNKYSNKDIFKNEKIILNYVGKKINNRKSKILNINLKEQSNQSNSIHKLLPKEDRKIILANNYAQTINILSPIVNINNQKKMNKKNLQKKIIMGAINNKSKLYTIKSNKNFFNKNVRNKNSKYLYNMKTIEDKNKSSINCNYKNNRDLIILSKGDEHLQNLAYEQAIIYDKRAYFRMYWAFLVDKQIILETFCKENYLTLFIIKLSFLVCTFQISFFLNAFFYTDEYISNAYHNNGVLDFFSGLPKSIYSFLATMFITNILSMLSNSKNELIFVIRKKRDDKNYLHFINIKLKKLRNKLIVYFFLVFILGVLFLYYVCSFCSVYYYSQKYWFIGCLESFLMDSLLAIISCVFLALFRYLSIKKHLKCFYILTTIINALL